MKQYIILEHHINLITNLPVMFIKNLMIRFRNNILTSLETYKIWECNILTSLQFSP